MRTLSRMRKDGMTYDYEIYRDKNVGDEQRVGFDTAEPTQSKPTRTRQGLGAPTKRSITNQSIEGNSTS